MTKRIKREILKLLEFDDAIRGRHLHAKLNDGLDRERYPIGAMYRNLNKLVESGVVRMEKRPAVVEISHYRLTEEGRRHHGC